MNQPKINRVSKAEYEQLLKQYQQAKEYQNESWLPQHTEAHRPTATDILYLIRHTIVE